MHRLTAKPLSRKVSLLSGHIYNASGIQDQVLFTLKSTYHRFLKMTVHVVWTVALRE